jgi:hypothetical protein
LEVFGITLDTKEGGVLRFIRGGLTPSQTF